MPPDPASLARIGKLALRARRLVEGFLAGLHRSPFTGSSVEFAEHRQYYPGDEIRHIDWRAHAKTDRYFVKEFEEETNLRAHLVLDASGSMGYRGAGESKLDHARLVAACLAYLVHRQRDAVGLAVHDDHLRQSLPARSSSKHVLHVLHMLETVRPGGETALAAMWDHLAARLPRRGLVVLLSDGFDEVATLLRALRHYRHRRQEVLLFHILAPEELSFPFGTSARFRDLEAPGRSVAVEPGRVRREYQENVERFCRQLREAARMAQADYCLLRTDEPVKVALGRYLACRRRR